MRRPLPGLPLLVALVVLAVPALPGAPALAADGGSAACNIPFEIARSQQLGEMQFRPGPYTLTLINSSDLDCAEANDSLRAALKERGAELPNGWVFDATTHVL